MNLINISEAAEMLGVHPWTLRQWDQKGKLKAIRTEGNHRRYRYADIEKIIQRKELEHFVTLLVKYVSDVYRYCDNPEAVLLENISGIVEEIENLL